jgi:hypothetical protein
VINETKFKAKPGASKCLAKIDKEIDSKDFKSAEEFIQAIVESFGQTYKLVSSQYEEKIGEKLGN